MTRPRLTDAEILAQVPEALRAEVQHSLNSARLMARTLDALATTDTCCSRCGRRVHVAGARDPNARYVCTECSTGDAPVRYPDTGFRT